MFDIPPWEGGTAVVHLDEWKRGTKLLIGCEEEYRTSLARTFVRPITDLTCDGCAALAVSRALINEPEQ